MISFALDPDQTLIQETLREFAKNELAPQARSAESARQPSAALKKGHAELGMQHIDLPESLGGQGATLCTTVVAEEELGWGDAALALALDAGYPGTLFLALARETGAEVGAVALAYCEPKGPAVGFGTTARCVDGGFAITGRKGWVADAASAQRFIVFAQLDGTEGWRGAAAFLVERGAQKEGALRVGPQQRMLGLEAVSVSEVMFEECRVAESALLCSGDALISVTRRMFARVGLKNAARQVGLARAAYELALEYTQERKAFGKPVAHFQANAFMLADMATDVDAARWLLWRAATVLDKASEPPKPTDDLRVISDAIVHAGEVAWRTADRGVQLLGGAGFVQDFPAEKRMRDTKALALVGAPAEWWRLDAAGQHLGHAIESALPSAAMQTFIL